MLENVMFIGLGFLSAVLVALMLAPPLWRHAVTKTTKHIRARSPLTMGEIQADRDQLRAAYAMETRKLEVASEQMKDRVAQQTLKLSTQSEEIAKLTAAIEGHSVVVAEKDEEILTLADRIATLEDELRNKVAIIAEQDRELKQRPELTRVDRSPESTASNGRIEPKLGISLPMFKPKKQPETGPLKDEVIKLIDEISDINLKKQTVESERMNLLKIKDNLEEQESAPADQIKANQMRLTALEVERARLKADLTGLEQHVDETKRKIEKLSSTWETGVNPFADLVEKLDLLSTHSAVLNDQLETADPPDGDTTPARVTSGNDAQTAANRPAFNGNGQSPKAEAEPVAKSAPKSQVKSPAKTAAKSKTKKSSTKKSEAAGNGERPQPAGSIPTLADRIRALQKETVQ